jgi:phenylalanyl-tRNA synthetase beta chain
MNTSVAWMNEYLDPPASPAEQAELLTRAGFPLEHREDVTLPDGAADVRQDIELTSNRGDCLCHVALAREIAAASGRKLKLPAGAPRASGPAASSLARVTNREPSLCPLYTARIIRGVKVGPSPPWLANRLIARGDVPRNNIVDASNFVLFELGQPTHVFDLAKLRGALPQIIIRKAFRNEPFLPIGEGAAEVTLSEHDLVIADAERAVAIAGVKGGALTAVSNSTTDILIEAATFDPVTVRTSSRRLGITSDSSYRFERGVHSAQVNDAADRLTALILQLAGGTLCDGVLSDGQPITKQRTVTMRSERCRTILGIAVGDEKMVETLARLGFQPQLKSGMITCAVPYPRNDIQTEIDLIEEVGRMVGLDSIPIAESIHIRVAAPQPTEMAKRAVSDALVGMGYVETVTHSLIGDEAARAFLPPGMQLLRVTDERAAEPSLRPSIFPSLLRVFALNRDRGARNVKLFESGAVFAQIDDVHAERVNLAFVHAAETPEAGLRTARGLIDRLVDIVFGPALKMTVEPTMELPWFAPGALVRVQNEILGTFGPIAPATLGRFNVDAPIYGAELGLPQHYHRYPPDTEARELPSFPAIERDVSAIVDDRLAWIEVKTEIDALHLRHLETIEFITTFRGKQIGAGRKSLTLRATFRAPDRTLKHEEIDGQMHSLMQALQSKFGAEIRT